MEQDVNMILKYYPLLNVLWWICEEKMKNVNVDIDEYWHIQQRRSYVSFVSVQLKTELIYALFDELSVGFLLSVSSFT